MLDTSRDELNTLIHNYQSTRSGHYFEEFASRVRPELRRLAKEILGKGKDKDGDDLAANEAVEMAIFKVYDSVMSYGGRDPLGWAKSLLGRVIEKNRREERHYNYNHGPSEVERGWGRALMRSVREENDPLDNLILAEEFDSFRRLYVEVEEELALHENRPETELVDARYRDGELVKDLANQLGVSNVALSSKLSAFQELVADTEVFVFLRREWGLSPENVLHGLANIGADCEVTDF